MWSENEPRLAGGQARNLALVVGACVVLSVMFIPAPASAASVTVPISVTVADSGAPGFMWTLTSLAGSCSFSPSSGATGSTVTVTMKSGCSFAIETPADGATARDRIVAPWGAYLSEVPETSCANGACGTVSLTAHVQELLAVGTGCHAPAVVPSSPTTDNWFNYGTSVQVTCDGAWGRSGSSGTRATSWNWDGGSNAPLSTLSRFTTAPQTMTGTHTLNVNTVSQFQLTLDSGATRAMVSLTPPTITNDTGWYDSGSHVTYVGNGIFGRSSGSGNRSSSWTLDTSTLPLATKNTFLISTTMSTAHSISVTVKTQYRVTLDSTTLAQLSSISAPPIPNDNYWFDSGTTVVVAVHGVSPRVSGVGTRVSSYAFNGGTPVRVATSGNASILDGFLTAPLNITSTVVAQYQLSLDAGASSALATITSPPIPGDNYWYDNGTVVTYTGNGEFGRSDGAGFRATGWWVDGGTANPLLTGSTFPVTVNMKAPHTLHATTVKQYEVNLVGGSGVASATAPTIPGDDYWYDGGTSVSLSLNGVFGRISGQGERVSSYTVNNSPTYLVASTAPVEALTSVSLGGPINITEQTVVQYQLTLGPVVVRALGSVTPPTVAGDDYWYDTGTAVTLTLHGTWERNLTTGFRLTSYTLLGRAPVAVATKGSVTVNLGQMIFPQSVSAEETTQYTLTVVGGMSVIYSQGPPISGDATWYDSGASVVVTTAGAYNSTGYTRQGVVSWSLDGGATNSLGSGGTASTTPIQMNAPHLVTFQTATQYLVAVVVKASGGTILPNAAVVLSVDGASVPAAGGEVWADSGASVQVSSVSWEGASVNPVSPQSYAASGPLTVTIDAKVYPAQVDVRDPLGVPVGGAKYSVTMANGTTVAGVTPGNGVIDLGLVPLGTYKGTVTYQGVTYAVSGDASVTPASSVLVTLDYPVVAALVLGAIVAITVPVLYSRSRRKKRQ